MPPSNGSDTRNESDRNTLNPKLKCRPRNETQRTEKNSTAPNALRKWRQKMVFESHQKITMRPKRFSPPVHAPCIIDTHPPLIPQPPNPLTPNPGHPTPNPQTCSRECHCEASLDILARNQH
jgi:hypothetical protein